jgi:DNA-binding NarL/FixJ family response regulator
MSYKVAIVDDHIIMTDAIASMISQNPAYQISFKAKNGKEVESKIGSSLQIPDLILMDINMPISNGIETTQWLSQHFKDVKVLALTMNDDEISIIKMFRAGAKGYLLKDVNSEELFFAMDTVLTKGFYYSDFVAPIMMNSFLHKGKEDNAIITVLDLKPNELEFLHHVCTELTYKQIADKMNLSPKTIDGYREHLFQKLDVKSRVGLVLYALRKNLVKL